MSGDVIDPTPQFGTAEYVGVPSSDCCQFCGQSVALSYYRVNNALTCFPCAEQKKRELPKDSHAAFVRAVLFGIGGAFIGLLLYAAVGIVTGLMIGYVSLAVGYVVGKAMMKGSDGVGGRRYQITAALLTYSAVSLAAVPIAITQYAKQKKVHEQRVQTQHQQLQDEQRQFEKEFGQQPQQSQPTPFSKPPVKKISLAAALGSLVLLGLASPFINLFQSFPLQGLIGLVILSVGIRIAWRTTAGKTIEIHGPYSNSVPLST
jgi:hypothetical protein